MEYLKQFAEVVFSIAFIFGPTSAYFFQYRLVKKTRSLGSFSIDVCAILIFANLLRILFWMCKPFEISLLFQSIVMISVQLFLLRECLKVRVTEFYSEKLTIWEKLRIENFWRWDDYRSYIEVLLICTGFISLLTLMFYQSVIYANIIGSASTIIEACLGLPQLLSNRRNKTTAGLSIGLIFVWFAGDLGKTLYFILQDVPLQFILCGFTQIMIDMYILYQIHIYGGTEYQELPIQKHGIGHNKFEGIEAVDVK